MEDQVRKRRTSTSPDGPDKRIRLSTSSSSTTTTASTVAGPTELAPRSAVFGSAEIFLHILSFLSVDEIINAERVCRYWKRMAEDSSLWRKMYLERFPYPSLHHLRAHTVAHSRPRAPRAPAPFTTPLPITPRSTPPEHGRTASSSVDWKTLMRIGTNWSTGNAVTHSLSPSPSPGILPQGGRLGEERRDGEAGPSSRKSILAEAVSPTIARRSIVAPIPIPPFPSHPPGFPLPPVIPSDTSTSYRPTLGPLRQRIPRAPPRPRIESHPQADVPKHLLCLAGNFVLVAYPNSPLLHVHDSRPLRSDPARHPDLDISENPVVAELSPAKDPTSMVDLNRPVALIPPPPGWSSPSRPDLITAMAVDKSGASESNLDVRVVLFYRSGGFVILTLRPPDLHIDGNDHDDDDEHADPASALGRIWTRETVHVPAENRKNRKRHYIPPPEERVVLAGIWGRVVVGVTGRFYISIYDVMASPAESAMGSTARLVKVIHSAVASWPASLSLDCAPNADEETDSHTDGDEEHRYWGTNRKSTKCVVRLLYCSPIYPRSWKPSVQDIMVELPPHPSQTTPTSTRTSLDEPEIVLSDPIELVRQPTSHSQPQSYGGRASREPFIGVKTRPGAPARVMAFSSGWVVLAGKDDLVEIYRVLPRPPPLSLSALQSGKSKTASASRQKVEGGYVIEHSQTLLGHGAGIRSIALRDGRCVTSGEDGRVLVWRLDRGATYEPPREGKEEEDHTSNGELDDERDLGSGIGWGRKGVVEIREGARRSRSSARDLADRDGEKDLDIGKEGWKRAILPVPPVTHPLSLVSAARELFLSSPIGTGNEGQRRKVRDLAFNEDTIVGLMLDEADGQDGDGKAEEQEQGQGVVRVWNFDA